MTKKNKTGSLLIAILIAGCSNNTPSNIRTIKPELSQVDKVSVLQNTGNNIPAFLTKEDIAFFDQKFSFGIKDLSIAYITRDLTKMYVAYAAESDSTKKATLGNNLVKEMAYL